MHAEFRCSIGRSKQLPIYLHEEETADVLSFRRFLARHLSSPIFCRCITDILSIQLLDCGALFMVPGKRPFVKGPRGSQVGRKPGAKAFGTKKTEQKKKGGKLTSVKNQIRAVKRLLAKVQLQI